MFWRKNEDPYFCLKTHGKSEKYLLEKTNIILVLLRPAILEYLEGLDKNLDNKSNMYLLKEFIEIAYKDIENTKSKVVDVS